MGPIDMEPEINESTGVLASVEKKRCLVASGTCGTVLGRFGLCSCPCHRVYYFHLENDTAKRVGTGK